MDKKQLFSIVQQELSLSPNVIEDMLKRPESQRTLLKQLYQLRQVYAADPAKLKLLIDAYHYVANIRDRDEVSLLSCQIRDGVKAITDSEQYKKVLNVMSKFHNYSINNIILIANQKKDASRVASITTWKKLGRTIKRSEITKPLKILAPIMRKPQMPQDDNTDIEPIVIGYKSAKVYDVSQTTGEPLPEPPRPHVLLGSVIDFDIHKESIESISPFPIEYRSFGGSAYGLCNFQEQKIMIRPDLSEQQTLKTLIHELTHALYHNSSMTAASRSLLEMEAESTAYVVCSHLGLDTSDYSFKYVAGWSMGQDLQPILAQIRDMSSKLISQVDSTFQMIKLSKQRQPIAIAFENDFLLLSPDSTGVQIHQFDIQSHLIGQTHMTGDLRDCINQLKTDRRIPATHMLPLINPSILTTWLMQQPSIDIGNDLHPSLTEYKDFASRKSVAQQKQLNWASKRSASQAIQRSH